MTNYYLRYIYSKTIPIKSHTSRTQSLQLYISGSLKVHLLINIIKFCPPLTLYILLNYDNVIAHGSYTEKVISFKTAWNCYHFKIG